MFSKFRPLYDRVLIQRVDLAEEKTAGGIIIPDSAKEKGQIGLVIEVGPGRLHDGQFIPLQVKKGDRVMFGKYAGTDAGQDMMIIREEEILGILE
jgi:Co-chaperonin GroES (HSP10)